MHNQKIVINGKEFSVYQFTGRVAQANKGHQVHFSGLNSNANPSVDTSTHDDIFLVNDEGKEHVLRLINWDIATREGHEIQAFWMSPQGETGKYYYFIRNLTTGSTLWGDQTLKNLFSLFRKVYLVVPAAIVSIILFPFGLIAPGYMWWRSNKSLKEARQKLQAIVESS